MKLAFPREASACNPSCDTANDYSGTASATCASMGAHLSAPPKDHSLDMQHCPACGPFVPCPQAGSVPCERGAAMTFSGCHPECNLPSPMTGYTGTCTGSAPQRANQCGVLR
eukprot:6468377-Amphidinium_carterae.6